MRPKKRRQQRSRRIWVQGKELKAQRRKRRKRAEITPKKAKRRALKQTFAHQPLADLKKAVRHQTSDYTDEAIATYKAIIASRKLGHAQDGHALIEIKENKEAHILNYLNDTSQREA